MRYINDDVKIVRRLTACRISEEEFKQKVIAETEAMDDYDREYYARCIEDGCDPFYQAIGALLYGNDRIRFGKEIEVDHENLDFETWWGCKDKDKAEELLDVHTIDGLTFCGMLTGGDWEDPLFMIFYWDGEKVCTYFPRKGNLINLDAMTAFGSEGDKLGDYVDELTPKGVAVRATYENLGLHEYMEEDWCDWTGAYYAKYGLDSEGDHSFNWDAIKEDIFGTIEVKGE